MGTDELRRAYEMKMDELRRVFLPRARERIARGDTAYLCGVPDGRGKVCGRALDLRLGFDLTDEYDVIMICPKHGRVVCEGAEFVAATRSNRRSEAVYFRTPRPEPIARRSRKP